MVVGTPGALSYVGPAGRSLGHWEVILEGNYELESQSLFASLFVTKAGCFTLEFYWNVLA